MTKLGWVLMPLMLYVVCLVGTSLRGRMPSRHALNVQLSLLLMVYLLTTASLGIFWVANQQLPVFDWHYMFGYGTVALVAAHLYFNLPMALRSLRGPQRSAAPALGKWATALVGIGALVGAYLLGTRQQADPRAPMAPAAGGVAAVVRFHEYSSESRGSVFRRAPGIDWGDAPPDFKRYPTAQHVELGRGGVGQRGLSESLRGFAPRTQALQRAELGDLLYLAAGVTQRRGGKALRAAPSSGALFPSELYVLARSVQGLAPGIYHYDPDHARLDVVGPLPAVSGAPSAEDADAAVVLTSVFRRTGYKYRDRAYRYVMADAGHLLENLRLASQSAGLQAKLAPRFDEARLARTLGVDGIEEGVLAIMELRRANAALGRSSGPRYVAPSGAPAKATGVTGMVHQATSLRLASDQAHDVIALPAPQAVNAEVRRVIAERRSKRRFTNDPVPLGELASILADMVQPSQLSEAIRINLVVNRVQGLAPGVYRYDQRHALTRVRSGDFAAAAESAALSQAVIGDAAVVLVLSADRDRLLAEGARGYRHGFLEAGLIGERWLLGAVARRLGACPVGAFYDDEAAALVNIDMQREWVLHFAALGLPAAD